LPEAPAITSDILFTRAGLHAVDQRAGFCTKLVLRALGWALQLAAMDLHPAQLTGLVLASASPRRRALLAQLGLHFSVVESGVDEPRHSMQEPAEYALGLAARKAEEVALRLAGTADKPFVLGADTIVVLGEAVLGKPEDDADAVRMLCSMQGCEHEVITAVALRRAGCDDRHSIAVRSRVEFRAFDADTAARYVASGEGRDKAGSYAVQGLGAGFIRAIHGSYSNVVGLPACETLELLIAAGAVGRWP
jgi:septum formation protein